MTQETSATAKPGRIIPPADATRGPLHLVLAVMCFLASLALGLAIGVSSVSESWNAGLTAALTVQLKPVPDMEPDAQQAAALDILYATPGFIDVRPVPEDEAAALLRPWLGGVELPEDLALPRLIDVRMEQDVRPDLDLLRRRLNEQVPGVVLDDHSQWQERIGGFAQSLTAVASAAMALISLATIAVVIFATRAGIAANRGIVDVLHLSGAENNFIAAQIQIHFLWLGLRAGLIGTAIAYGTLLLLGVALGGDHGGLFLPALEAGLGLYLSLLIIPVAIAIASLITARLTTLGYLKKIF